MTKFYAVCSKKGVVNMGDEDYPTQKAVFKKVEEASKAIERNPEVGLFIKEVYIAVWDE